ncbi:MFS drug transporter [Pyrenophora seminiperda CCB06]|uniref:MFS drug transporter n=1 Tax=Pyrenophora seminiperda CCB06 TaxID=1302712 RepID=A0A3M7M1C0_9PLEO|nr:MFS drug transporter [Pyrenophora seminiperda CCB06]
MNAELSSNEQATLPAKEDPLVLNEQTNYVPVKTIITIFLACSSVDLLALMDQTTLAASLTIVSKDLNARSESAWIAGAYFLTSTSFQLVYGRLSDIWSRKVLLLVGIVIFFFGSLAASLAQSALQLIVFRALMGVGGGGLMTMAQLIISDIVPLRERGKYQGIMVGLSSSKGDAEEFADLFALGVCCGAGEWNWADCRRRNRFQEPRLMEMDFSVESFSVCADDWVCGVLYAAEESQWQKSSCYRFLWSVFSIGWFNTPGGMFALFQHYDSSLRSQLSLTWAGGQYKWESAHVISTLVVGVVISVSFIGWQWKGTTVPLIPMEIFKSRVVNGATLTMFVNGWNFLVQVYYIPSFYQLVYGYSAVKAGALLLPITLTQTVFSTFSGLVIHWTGRYRECLLLGWAVWAIGLGLLSTLSDKPTLAEQVGYGLLAGLGLGNTLQPSLIAIQAGTERKHMAVVTSTRNFIRNLGGTLGLAISGTIINNAVRSSLVSFSLNDAEMRLALDSPDVFRESFGSERADLIRNALALAYKRGFRVIFIVGAGLNVLAFIAAWFLMPQVELNRKDDAQLKEEGKKREEAKREKSSPA